LEQVTNFFSLKQSQRNSNAATTVDLKLMFIKKNFNNETKELVLVDKSMKFVKDKLNRTKSLYEQTKKQNRIPK